MSATVKNLDEKRLRVVTPGGRQDPWPGHVCGPADLSIAGPPPHLVTRPHRYQAPAPRQKQARSGILTASGILSIFAQPAALSDTGQRARAR